MTEPREERRRGERNPAPPPDLSWSSSSNVLNLSRLFSPSVAQIKLLEKGLTFIPAPRNFSREELRRDLHWYHRRLKLRDYFGNEDFCREPFILPSGWEPEWEALSEQLRNLIKKDICSFHSFWPRAGVEGSLSEEERQAFEELRENKNIVIKPADKGSKIVIMDKHQYRLEAQRQLGNIKYYKRIPYSIQPEVQLRIRKIIYSLYHNKYISAKQRDYLLGPDDPRPRLFYLLPKIHKKPETWTVKFEIPPGRPIVSDCNSVTYNVSQYIDSFLGPLSNKHPSYLKDTYHFLHIIRSMSLPKNAFLFTIDIDSLYTNINTEMGLRAVSNIFRRFPDTTRPDAEVLRLLEICLTNNDFQFDNKAYLQMEGTAMGQRYAPSYANIYMSEWEREALAKCPLQPIFYLRFLDDIIGAWTHGEDAFQQFVHILNTHHSSIKLKYEHSDSEINFLDTTVFFEEEKEVKRLHAKVYFKPTDTHALLHKSSYHPPHTFRGIVKSQILRFRRICSREEDFHNATHILFRSLRRRGYSRSFLRRTYRETLSNLRTPNACTGDDPWGGRVNAGKRMGTEQGALSSPSTIEDENGGGNPLPFVSTFHDKYIPFFVSIQQNLSEMQTRGRAIEARMIRAFRKNPSLGDLLVKAKLEGRETEPPDALQHFMVHRQMINNPHSGISWAVRGRFSLEAKNVVYAIQCTCCGLIYVGETGARLRARLQQHLYAVRAVEPRSVVAIHFREHAEGALSIMGLQANPGWSVGQRRRMERIWINRLNTHVPLGLNAPT